jgi:protein-L-isoaspartate(D-aspartate) O-methyltransferase
MQSPRQNWDLMMIDHATQRLNMVESQVRPSDVTDRRITRAMRELPREAFVPGPLKSIAYADEQIKVSDTGGKQRFILAPRLLAKLVQLLEIEPDGLVLDVGPATGYSTALLPHLAQTVVALEEDAGLAERTQEVLSKLGVDNAVVIANAMRGGAADEGPYDAILINGAVADVPPAMLDQLKDGGRCAAVHIENGVGRATVWCRHGMSFDRRPAFDASAPYLPGFEPAAGFVF